jgi:hypothetical protein
MRFPFVILSSLVIGLVFAACKTQKHPVVPVPIPESGPVVSGQKEKDKVVLAEADKIDALAPNVKDHTDKQRKAVADAPAVDVEKIVAEYEIALKSRDVVIAALKEENGKLTKKLAEALEKGDFYIRIGGYALAGLLVAAGVASFWLQAQLAFLGPKVGLALISAGGSVFAMMQAYDFTKDHPWVAGLTLALVLIAGVLAYANNWHEKQSVKSS